jgi:Rps23 Pro-64 3,4-dihydroxylase Tpa1-like proline 4-hydroxylase
MSETVSLKNKAQNAGIKLGKERVNPKVLENVAELKNSFLKNAFVEVENFLSDSFAEFCHDFYFRKMPLDWWQAASIPNKDSSKSEATFQKEYEDKSETYQHCLDHFEKGDFCYFFHRTVDDHEKLCDCGECDIRRFFKSSEMFGFLSDLSGRKISSDSGHFSSWYRKGDFLSAHHDDGNGQIGVVLDFAKNWNPVFGGNLFILEDDWATCKKVITPKFNNLKVFDIPKEKKGVPHFVSTVLADSDLGQFSERKRIAFGGWFN